MQTIEEMRAEINQIMARLGSLKSQCTSEGREPTDEERDIAKGLLDRVDRLNELIAMEARIKGVHDHLAALEHGAANDPIKPDLDGGSRQNADRYMANLDAKDRFPSFGDQLLAIRSAATSGHIDARLNSIHRAVSGASEGVPSEGGFLVQPDFATELLTRTYDTGIIVPRCRKISVSGNGLKINAVDETSRTDGNRWGGILAYWKDEGGLKTKSKPKFRQMELSLKKLIGLCYATDELLEDAAALESVIMQGFSEEFGFMMDEAVLWGSGAGMPRGIMNCPCLISITRNTGGGSIDFQDIVNMWARMWGRSRQNSVWLINQDAEPGLMTMTLCATGGTGCGTPVYLPANGAADRPYATLFGRPVIPCEHCQTLGTSGDIILADFSQYLLIDKGAMQSAQSIHVRFIYDESVFRFVYRADGQCIWNAALTPRRGSNTLGPFVVLA